MDLLEKNYTVHVLADGVSSRTMVERIFALEVIQDMEVLDLLGRGGGVVRRKWNPVYLSLDR